MTTLAVHAVFTKSHQRLVNDIVANGGHCTAASATVCLTVFGMPNDVIRKLVEAHLKARPLSGDYQGLSGTITIEGEYDRAPTVGQIYELIRRNKFRWVL